jgi:hypothetical protein
MVIMMAMMVMIDYDGDVIMVAMMVMVMMVSGREANGVVMASRELACLAREDREMEESSKAIEPR